MTTSEPTTGEIVRALREVVSDPMFRIHEIAKRCRVAADRLESQERELSGLSGKLEKLREFHERYAEQTSTKYVNDILALTARAEQAEKERDEAADQDGDHHDETDALYRFVGELAYAPHRTRNEDARYGRQETDREEQEIGFHGGYVRLSRSAWN